MENVFDFSVKMPEGNGEPQLTFSYGGFWVPAAAMEVGQTLENIMQWRTENPAPANHPDTHSHPFFLSYTHTHRVRLLLIKYLISTLFLSPPLSMG